MTNLMDPDDGPAVPGRRYAWRQREEAWVLLPERHHGLHGAHGMTAGRASA